LRSVTIGSARLSWSHILVALDARRFAARASVALRFVDAFTAFALRVCRAASPRLDPDVPVIHGDAQFESA
jgi:hypothetical protein